MNERFRYRAVRVIGPAIEVWFAGLAFAMAVAGQMPAGPEQASHHHDGGAAQIAETRGPVQDDDATMARGLLEAGIEYGRAWRSGDFLAELREGVDTVRLRDGQLNSDGLLVERRDLFRVGFDFPSRRMRVLHLHRSEILDLSRQRDGLPSLKNRDGLFAAVLDRESTSFVRDFPGKVERRPLRFWYRGSSPPGLLLCRERVRFPDLRGYVYTGGPFPGGLENAIGIAGIRPGKMWDFVETKRLAGGQLELKYRAFGPDRDDGPLMDESWVIDAARLVPLRRQMTDFRDGKLLMEGRFEWIEKAGIQVLTGAIEVEPGGWVEVNLERHSGEKVTELRIHWFRFNEELPEEMFDGRILDDEEAVRALLDPVRSGADTLLSPRPPRDSNSADNGQRP